MDDLEDVKQSPHLTCGLLNFVGLPARKLGGIIVYNEGEKKSYIFHSWAELYLNGFWTLFDPAGDNKTYPRLTAPFYYTYSADLPKFLDQTIEKAKLRINYVKG